MTMRRLNKTAAELLKELQDNPEVQAQRQKREEALRSAESELAKSEGPLLNALAKLGVEVGSIWDLVNRPTNSAELVAVLMDHLDRPYPDAIREGIARALTVAEARSHWSELLSQYRKERGQRAKQGLAVAIGGIATDNEFSDVLSLLKDKSQGTSRVLLLLPLERSYDPRALSALKELVSDPELGREIRLIFKRKGTRM